ncbi:MAG: acyl-CoA thioesterase [Ignavibacteria bacterium]|jgi:YbgC/YbaW family acyl-CoA thioester hydrolase|nr:acyl-CoA thioesterase [Ignavibacteria bacterium]
MISKAEEVPALLNKFKHTTTGYVKFHEVDTFRVTHNLKYLEWTEVARVEYCRNIGISILPDMDNVQRSFSIFLVHSEVNYFAPATYFDKYIIYTRVCKLGKTSVTFEHIITKENGVPLCINQAVEVYVGADQHPIDVDEYIRRKIVDYEGDNIEF